MGEPKMRTVREHEDAFLHIKWSHLMRGIVLVALSWYASFGLPLMERSNSAVMVSPLDPTVVFGVFGVIGYFSLVYLILTIPSGDDT